MNKFFLFLLFLLILPKIHFANDQLVKGEKLQVLYQKVWAYDDPTDLSTRQGPYSYSIKMTYQGKESNFPDYLKVLISDKRTAFIKQNLVASSKIYSLEKLKKEVELGKRKASQYDKFNSDDNIQIEWWQSLGVFAIIALGLYFLWKRFYKIDRWFASKSSKRKPLLKRPWFIKYSLLTGVVIGGFYSLLAPTETEWFLYEGIRLWANYPSFIDWILWGALWIFAFTFVTAIIVPFYRFSIGVAFSYVIMLMIIMLLYFLVGLLSGGIVAAIYIFYLFGSGSSSSGSDRPYNSNKPNVPRDPSKSPRWNDLNKYG